MLNSNPINEEEMKMTVEALRKDMVAAMKAKDKTTKEAVSALISAAKKQPSTKDAVMIFRKRWLTA